MIAVCIVHKWRLVDIDPRCAEDRGGVVKPMRYGKAQLEDRLAPVDMAPVMWMPLRGGSETRLRGRLDRIRGSPGRSCASACQPA